jgi:hypothetical protein
MYNSNIESKTENNSSQFNTISSKKSEFDIDEIILIEDKLKKSLSFFYIIFHSILLSGLSVAILYLQFMLIMYGKINNFNIGIW